MSGKRSIFEEVGETAKPAVGPQGGMIGQARKGARGAIRVWLWGLAVLVAAMIVLGALTRTAAFAGVGHIHLGRSIALVWAAGFLFLWATRRIPVGWTGRLVIPGALGAVQGALGLWAVSGGGVWLAVHTGLAFAILGFLIWYALLLGRSEAGLLQARRVREAKLFSLTTGLLHFALLQIVLGALLAGIGGGAGFPTWPLMNGAVFPAGAFDLAPFWLNFHENPAFVQFVHRTAGLLLLAFGVVVWLRGSKSAHPRTRKAFHGVFAVLILQTALGVVTVLTQAHPHVALTHLVVAVLLWGGILYARYLAQYPVAQSIRG